jgi:hypothetical protein
MTDITRSGCAIVYSLSVHSRIRLCSAVSQQIRDTKARETAMLWRISLILLILISMWLMGMVSSYTMNRSIDIFLVIAILTVLLRLISGRRLV